MEITVRHATIDDVDKVLKMTRRLYEFAVDVHGLNFSPEAIIRYMVILIEQPQGLLLVAEVNGEVVGTVAGEAIPWHGDLSQGIFMEKMWWVEPEYRKSGVAGKLLETVENMAKDAGLSFVAMSVVVSDMNKVIEGYLGRKGFKPMETYFIKEV